MCRLHLSDNDDDVTSAGTTPPKMINKNRVLTLEQLTHLYSYQFNNDQIECIWYFNGSCHVCALKKIRIIISERSSTYNRIINVSNEKKRKREEDLKYEVSRLYEKRDAIRCWETRNDIQMLIDWKVRNFNNKFLCSERPFFDFHGMSVYGAVEFAEQIIAEFWGLGKEVRFVTGKGNHSRNTYYTIKNEVQELFKYYRIKWSYPYKNEGMMIVIL